MASEDVWTEIEVYKEYAILVNRNGQWTFRLKNDKLCKRRYWGPADVRKEIDKRAARKHSRRPLKGKRVVVLSAQSGAA